MDRPLAQITRAEVRQRHQRLAAEVAAGKYSAGRPRGPQHGRATANALFRTFRSVWNRALREHPALPPNPCINVDWFQTKTDRKALAAEQLPLWAKALGTLGNPVRKDLLRFMLFSGLRRESAATMRWADVDFQRKALRVPRPKGGEQRAFELPLSDELLEIVKRRRAEHAAICAGNHRMAQWVGQRRARAVILKSRARSSRA